MTPTPTWAGAWRQDWTPETTWLTRIARAICELRQHKSEEREHIHGWHDLKVCMRCGRQWVRDGCVARQCGERGEN